MQFVIQEAVSSTVLFAEKRMKNKSQIKTKNNNGHYYNNRMLEEVGERKKGCDKYGKQV